MFVDIPGNQFLGPHPFLRSDDPIIYPFGTEFGFHEENPLQNHIKIHGSKKEFKNLYVSEFRNFEMTSRQILDTQIDGIGFKNFLKLYIDFKDKKPNAAAEFIKFCGYQKEIPYNP